MSRLWAWLLASGPFGRLRGGGVLALEQVLALDARRRLYIVRCEQRRVLLLIGGQQDLVVGWLDAAVGEPATTQ